MTCSCPKCRAHVELDLPEVPEEGTQATCPECKARFTITRESFGSRALHKTGEITCAACGAILGPHLHCPSCGVLYPAYLAATMGRKKRRTLKKVELATSPFPKREVRRVALPRLDGALPQATQSRPKGKSAGTAWLSPKVLTAVIVLVLVAVGGAATYLHQKTQKAFTANFILTVYATTVGEKKGQEICGRIAADWKAKTDAGQTVQPRTPVADLNYLASLKSQIDGFRGMLDRNKGPKDLAESMDKLDNLYAAYNKTESLAKNPTGTPASYAAALNKADTDYNAAARNLKAGLPAPVLTKMRAMAKLYKGLQGFLAL